MAGRSTGKAPRAKTGGQFNPKGGRVVAAKGRGSGKTPLGKGGHQMVEHSIKPRTIASH